MDGTACRILIVAHRTATEAALVNLVAARAGEGATDFALLVPAAAHGLHQIVDPEDHCCAEAQAVLERAIPVLSRAAGSPVSGTIGSHDPYAAVLDALNAADYDEVIVSTHPKRLSRWLHLDLPRRIGALGIPVTTVSANGGGAGSAIAAEAAA